MTIFSASARRIKSFAKKLAPFANFKISNWHLAAVLILAFGFFLAGINRAPTPTLDGSLRAVEAKNILVNNQWYPITLQDEIITDHPPLYVWLTAVSYKIFGLNDFASNVPGRVAAFLTVLLVYLIAIQAGFSKTVGLVAAFILLMTRDFILSSVRGYIEPVMNAFVYGAFYLILLQKDSKEKWFSYLAGTLVWLALFSKGPPALWPFLFLGAAYCFVPKLNLRTWSNFNHYLVGFFLCTAAWTIWNQANGFWPYWKEYFFGQVLHSAVGGRGGAQSHAPLYFPTILLKYYWPWLPLLIWALIRSISWTFQNKRNDQIRYSWMMGVLGLGFVAGFSIVKWKFWYYIAPAYPAFALFIAIALKDVYEKTLSNSAIPKALFKLGFIWVLVISVFPIHLHRDRIPEVTAFKSTIQNSNIRGPVWFVEANNDHNLVGTSGEWYFGKIVKKVKNPKRWNPPKRKSWIIAGNKFLKTCKKRWCSRSIRIQQAAGSTLLYHKR